jgi:hypothetical protein
MRNFDNYEQIHDNEGNLLVGKLVFCRKGTTEQEPIYAWDSEHNNYVAINPEVLININGRPDQQIFLSDTDYTIYVYKYIGSGEMDQDSEENNWLAQYSFNNLYLTFAVDIKTDSPYLVSNMTELQETDPANVGVTAGKTLVCLGGYNALGDCPPVFYYWDDLSTKTANGVDIVAVTGISVGRWLLVNTFTEIGFDVRHAGCFAEKTAAETSINQSYAIQRADTYALKYGLKIVFPDLYSDTYSYYLLTNLIVNSEVVAADGVKLLTANSATLNFVSEENLKKKEPFILHDGTYRGTWSVKGETIRTGYFENNESLSNTNWPPTITANKKYIYDASFNCYGTTPNISLINKEVVFNLLLENESYTLTNCNIESRGKIKHACSFTNCEIKGSFFDPSLTDRNICDFGFTNCNSDLDSWNSVNKYVVFKIVQGDTTLDLQGNTCSLDWSSYGGGLYYQFPFTKVCNAIFSSLTTFPNYKNGNKKALFVLENVTMNHLELDQDDGLLNWFIRSSTIVVYRHNSGTIQNARIIAFNSDISGGSGSDSIVAKTFNFFDCLVNIGLTTPPTAALTAIFDNCSIYNDISLYSSSTFNITFTNNVISNSALLYLRGNSSNQTFVNSVFTNNTITDGPREFISSSVSWNYSSIGNYEYRNNTGTEKPDESIKLALRIPWYSYEATIPSGKKRYLHQKSNNSNSCSLHGIRISDLFFSFGENTKNDILVRTDPIKTTTDYSLLIEYSSSGSFVNGDTYDKVAGALGSSLYRKGQSATKEILDGTYTNESVIVSRTGLSDGDLCDIVLLVDKVYYANATGEILK